jgi:hypothetical protein
MPRRPAPWTALRSATAKLSVRIAVAQLPLWGCGHEAAASGCARRTVAGQARGLPLRRAWGPTLTGGQGFGEGEGKATG